VQPLRAPRANPVFHTDEKRIRMENTVIDKSNNRGLSLKKGRHAPAFGFASTRFSLHPILQPRAG
jgi:hypothetical protein